MKKGFSLIEVLVVVLIIGILTSIALPQYRKAVVKSHYAKLKPFIAQIADAEEVYYSLHNKYTINMDELDINFDGTAEMTSATKMQKNFPSVGDCGIEVSAYEARAYCIIYNVGYGKYFYNSKSHAGKQACKVYGNANDFGHSICKEDSSGASPSLVATNQYQYLW